MPTWTHADLKAYQNRRALSRAKPQRDLQNEPLAAPQGAGQDAGRVSVRYTCYRCRLIDPENVFTKWWGDCLRYAGFLKDDREQDIELTVRQVKVKTKAEERTEIEVG